MTLIFSPTNLLPALRLLTAVPAGPDLTLTWPSSAGRSYFLEWSADLSASPPFLPLATNICGWPGTTSFTDTNAASSQPRFYCVEVQGP
jgi:hypothetical protein